MPAKAKGSVKASTPEAQAAPTPASSTPTTVADRTKQRFLASNVLQNKVNEQGYNNLAPAEKKTYAHAKLLLPVCQERVPLNAKTERDFWKLVNKESLPIRQLRDDYNWGKDKSGRDISTYTIEDLDKRTAKQAQLAALKLLHQHFLSKRRLAQQKGTDLPKEVVEEEKERRWKMSGLRKDLYGQIEGTLANDPEWDDIVPIANTEPEDALAKIAYPDDYAEAVSYLRAVMAAEEYSPRCLRLTDLVIEMNPAHYTVWLYRFKIVRELNLPVPDEIKWLNEVSLENLKNYQIWHHRQLLLNYYYPILTSESADSAQAINDLAKSERDFIGVMLKEDTKNYHVWSYRQALVKKLGQFNVAELASTQNLIEDDVRNNSAWSHRFFLTFADPAHSTPDSGPTEHDAKVPDTIIDKEVKYAQEKIALAPQNQSPWNYMRGVLAKGGRKLSSVAEFAEQYVDKLGQDDEVVRSSHALDLLSEVYAEQSDKAKAKLCLERLATKWDPVREGYWKYRESQLA